MANETLGTVSGACPACGAIYTRGALDGYTCACGHPEGADVKPKAAQKTDKSDGEAQ